MMIISSGLILARLLAEVEAKGTDHVEIRPEHFWMALSKLSEFTPADIQGFIQNDEVRQELLIHETSELRRWFQEKDIQPKSRRRKLRRIIGFGTGSPSIMHRSQESLEVFERAVKNAESLGKEGLNTIHLAEALLEHLGAKISGLPNEDPGSVSGGATNRNASQQESLSLLKKLGRDITDEARLGRLEPLVGRRSDLLKLTRLLSQKRKRNAILVGDPGVGKTHLIEGLAQRIAAGNCPDYLKGKKLLEISISALVGGTKHRGDLEERLERLINEAESDSDVIIFIDEFQTVMADQDRGLSMANIMKPALARGRLQVVGATTTNDFVRFFSNDQALARRFEIMWVEEPCRAEALAILEGAKTGLEKHYNCRILQNAMEAALDLSIRYLPESRLPDKALDLLDQVCAYRSVQFVSIGKSETLPAPCDELTYEDIATVLAQRLRMPVETLLLTDSDRIGSLKTLLGGKIIGQKHAIETITATLSVAYNKIRDTEEPVASFLFTGPTGVGKTETAKLICKALFGSDDALVRIDMSEYTEKHQISRLIGAPPGYVGSDQPGLLVAAVRARAASLILFDEIEKAHPDVLNLLLQILDYGRLTDAHGRPVFFRETIVVMTTNVVHKKANPPGFIRQNGIENKQLVATLKKHLRPELIGRIDHIVLFNALDQEAKKIIADNYLHELTERLHPDLYDVAATVRSKVEEMIKSTEFGAREIKKIVEHKLSDAIASRSRGEIVPEKNDNQEITLITTLRPHAQIETAMLIVDLIGSTQLVRDEGDTYFSALINQMHNALRRHASSDELVFLKCTGDGFFAAYKNVKACLTMARSILESENHSSIRMAVHWGAARTGPDGDLLGVEVHRAFRMEALRQSDIVRSNPTLSTFPERSRIMISKSAREQLSLEEKSLFTYAGQFKLKGFEDPYEIWIISR
jgi:ATP-dependent Clp protease ATP-binding subunit ClpC